MEIVYERWRLVIAELWLSNTCGGELPDADIVRFCDCLTPLGHKDCKVRNYTSVVDLTPAPEELLAKMRPTTRKLIRRASQEGFVHDVLADCSAEQIDEFCDFVDELSADRGLRPVFRPRLAALAKSSALVITSIRMPDGPPLAMHAYVPVRPRAAMVQTASALRREDSGEISQRLGRAHRYLHWRDMLYFRDDGYTVYELGGIDVEGKDDKTAQIAAFKTSLGATAVPEYHLTIARTLKGRLVQTLMRLGGVDY